MICFFEGAMKGLAVHRPDYSRPDSEGILLERTGCLTGSNWVAVKELELSYYIGETLLFTTYTHYDNLI